jgi:hypothetical protein
MNPPQTMAQILDWQKTMFDTSFSILTAVQDQTGDMVDMLCKEHAAIPESSKKVCTHWIAFYKQNRKNFKNYVDTGFDRVKEFLEDSSVSPAGSNQAKK